MRSFAAAKRESGAPWPLGTGPYRIDPWGEAPPGPYQRVITARPAAGDEGPILEFILSQVPDGRDLLEEGVDVMITGDPAVIDYAVSRPWLVTVSLPWDRIYILLSTSRIAEMMRGGSVGMLPSALRDGFARDAVRGDARGSRSPSWWSSLGDCSVPSDTMPERRHIPRSANVTAGLHRIIYEMSDPVARDLAERIVAFAAMDPSASPETEALAGSVPGLIGDEFETAAQGVTSEELASSLREGDDFAYIFALPLRPADPCYEACLLAKRVPWLDPEEIDLSIAFVPLVDTRRHVIARRGRAGLMIDWSGDLFIVNSSQ